MIKKALAYFLKFHKGAVNIVLHVIGFAGVFYSIYRLDWVMFAVFLIILESGHLYNHVRGIEKYNLKPKILFWRMLIFVLAVGLLCLYPHIDNSKHI